MGKLNITTEQLIGMGHEQMPPLKAIRLKCLDCCCGNPNEVRSCVMTDCALWPFRMRKNPWAAPISDERRKEYRERAKKLFHKEKNHPVSIE